MEKDALLTKLLKLKPPSEKQKERVLKSVRERKHKFREIFNKLSPESQAAFRSQFDGEMGRILDEGD